MNSRNDLYYFTDANLEDDRAILEILEEPDFSGDISIVYTRRPSALKSLQSEGQSVKVLLCKRKDTDDLVGFGVCAIRDFYVSGKQEKVGYLSGLRIKKAYRKKFIPITKAYDKMGDYLKQNGVKWVYTTVLEDNVPVIKMFSKRRKSMPNYNQIGSYTVYSPSTRLKRKKGPYEVRSIRENELDILESYLEDEGKKSDFFPCIDMNDLRGESYLKLDYRKFYILLEKNKIRACAYVQDRHDKQHVLHSYSSKYKILKMLSPLLVYFGYPKLPNEGSILKYYNLAFLRVTNKDQNLLNYFIRELSHIHTDYDYFLLGMTEEDSLNDVMKKMSKVTYKSRVYRVDYDKTIESEALEKNLHDLYIECGFL